jgi:hypothetical protein
VKKCPFCAEQIQDEAIKCRFCGEFLNKSGKSTTKWYFSCYFVVLALLCIGPLALPLVWINPRWKTTTKILVTIVVVAVSIVCVLIIKLLYIQLERQIGELGL